MFKKTALFSQGGIPYTIQIFSYSSTKLHVPLPLSGSSQVLPLCLKHNACKLVFVSSFLLFCHKNLLAGRRNNNKRVILTKRNCRNSLKSPSAGATIHVALPAVLISTGMVLMDLGLQVMMMMMMTLGLQVTMMIAIITFPSTHAYIQAILTR